MHSFMPPYRADQKALLRRVQYPNITVGPPPLGTDARHLMPQCQAPRSPTRPAMPPGTPYVCLCGCVTYYASLHMFIWRICSAEWDSFTAVYICMCVSLSIWRGSEGGRDSSDKLPHLGRFRRSERSRGEAFISETEKRDRIKMERVWKKMRRRVRGWRNGGERRKRVR